MKMRVLLGLFTAIAVAGCDKPSDQAKAELGILSRNGGTDRELCIANRKVAEAYLAEGNEDEYKNRKISVDLSCSAADLRDLVNQQAAAAHLN